MSVLEDALPASYAGVRFLMQGSRIVGGFKDVKHEFPNSNEQSIQTLGGLPRSYNVKAIVGTDPGGENYAAKRDTFLRVLEAGGRNVFIHPLYGRINNVKVRTYNLAEEFTNLGEAVFEIQFDIDTTDGLPIVSVDTVAQVSNIVNTAISGVSNNLANNFLVSTAYTANFTAAIDKLRDVTTAFRTRTSFLQVAATQIDVFSSQLGTFESDVTSLVRSPVRLADSVTSLFNTVNGLYATVDATFAVLTQFFTFGDSDAASPIVQNTASRIERAKNQALINDAMKCQALALAYGNASQLNYSTIDEITETTKILETQYQSIVQLGTLDNATLSLITKARAVLQQYFEDQKLTAQQVVEVSTFELPARVIAYQYYGGEVAVDLPALNTDLNVSFMSGAIKVVAS